MGGVHGILAHAAREEANELPVVKEVAPDLPSDDKNQTSESDQAPDVSSEPALKDAPDSAVAASGSDAASENQPDEGLVQLQDGEEAAGEEATQEEAAEAEAEETAAEEEQETKKPPLTIDDIRTAPFDIRFPTTNQTKHCYTRYNEFHKCRKERGDGAPECEKYRRYYRSLCPSEWIQKWNDEREMGIFPGPY